MRRASPPDGWPWVTTIVSGLFLLFASISHLLNETATDTLGFDTYLSWSLALLVQVVLILVNMMNVTHALVAHRTDPSRGALWSIAIPLVVALLCLLALSRGTYIP